MQKNPQRDVMEREGGICFKQNWFVPHLHFIIFIPTLTTPHAFKKGVKGCVPKEVILPDSVLSLEHSHQVLTMLLDLYICDGLFLV